MAVKKQFGPIAARRTLIFSPRAAAAVAAALENAPSIDPAGLDACSAEVCELAAQRRAVREITPAMRKAVCTV